MARTRYIKPDAFTDQDLGDLPVVVRWFFAGMWTQADREGRLEDRPRELKLKLIPYDKETGEYCVDQLIRARKVIRYHVGGRSYLWIVNFKKHQHVHQAERPSVLPEPPPQPPETPHDPNEHRTSTEEAPDEDGAHPSFNGNFNGNGNGEREPLLEPETEKKPAAVFEMPSAEDFEPDASGCYRETAWGFWGWHNQERQKHELFDEPQPPSWKAFKTWHDTAAQEVGAAGLQQAFELYLADEDFAPRGWPISVFMKPTVYPSRASARAPQRPWR